MLDIRQFIFNNFGENTYLAIDKATKEAAVIDPGMLMNEEYEFFDKFIKENNICITQIILTHAHLDHCFGANYVKQKYNVPVKAHEKDVPLGLKLTQQGKRFGMVGVIKSDIEFNVHLHNNDIIEIGESSLKVLWVPGHSPGGIILYSENDGVAFVGDTIFQGSIGRTDLEGGDYKTLINSIINQILTLPDTTLLLPGHGEATTVASEKPYFQ